MSTETLPKEGKKLKKVVKGILAFLIITIVVLGLTLFASALLKQVEKNITKTEVVESIVDFLEDKGYIIYRANFFPFTNEKVKYKTFETWFEKLEQRNPIIINEKYEVYLHGSTFWFKEGIFLPTIHYFEVSA